MRHLPALLFTLSMTSLAATVVGCGRDDLLPGTPVDPPYPQPGDNCPKSSFACPPKPVPEAGPGDAGLDARPDARPDASPDASDAGPDAKDPCEGVVCSAPNGAAECKAGACVITACDPGFGDCDGDAKNGCEPLSTLHEDKDGDGHGDPAVTTLACPGAPGWVAGGDDCDDGDARAYPDQASYFPTPRPGGSFDFDCDGKVEREQTRIDPQYCLCGPGGCSISRGWKSEVPECGDAGDYAWEPASPAACDIRYVSMTQACR